MNFKSAAVVYNLMKVLELWTSQQYEKDKRFCNFSIVAEGLQKNMETHYELIKICKIYKDMQNHKV